MAEETHTLKDRTVTIKYGEQSMVLREGTLSEQFDYEDNMEKAIETKIGKEVFKAHNKYLIMLGADEKILKSLSSRQYHELLDTVAGKKK